ncbi:hypothetical protein HK103_002161 [Boothiomyces macroporosus]|uniref:MIF4G domain-containing protein n=1 Tax=Boothiomyces macroporosus TaxID=261099 RepID=A0AAD5UMM5_9FUNG|nr:hypothetical protein HK103_002161 [Boothiomyces macroporosus]
MTEVKESISTEDALDQINIRLKFKKENVSAKTVRADPSSFAKLDGSIKKNTSFIKKIKAGITAAQLSSLKKDLLSLKMEKYLEEIVASIADSTFKTSNDVLAAVEICTMMNYRFQEFGKLLLSNLLKYVGSSYSGINGDGREKEEQQRVLKLRSTLRFLTELYLVGIAEDGLKARDEFVPAILFQLFAKDKSLQNLNLAVTFVKVYALYFFPDSVVGQLVSDEAVLDLRKQLVPSNIQEDCYKILSNYYDTVKAELLKEHKKLQKIDKWNQDSFIARGEISEGRQEEYEKRFKSFEKLRTSTQTLSSFLNLEMPELPTEEVTRMGITISDGRAIKDESAINNGIWEDEETKSFYEGIIDLANQVPTILLGQKQVKQEFGESVVPEEEKAMVTDLENKEIKEMEPEKEEVEEEVETQEPEDNLEKLGSNQAVFVSLANRLANALNKDAIDQIAVEFAFINNKGTRKQLAQTLLGVSRQRLDLLPYYSRLIATLNPYMPDIGTMVVEEVFLRLEIILRKKSALNMDTKYSFMIDNAIYVCNPPDIQAAPKKVREPIELFLRKLIYKDLSRPNARATLKLLRKVNWEDELTKKTLQKLFFKIWKVKYSNLNLMAFLIAELSRFYPSFGVSVVDSCLEQIRIGLELNLFKQNQRRLACIKFLGELYNYRMVHSHVIFDTLYLLLRFGHENGIPMRNNNCPIDAPNDFFRLRLVCTLLDTCGHCFRKGHLARKLDDFYVFMQLYLFSKDKMPIDTEFFFMETKDSLCPKLEFIPTLEECVNQVNAIARSQMQEQDSASEDEEEMEDQEDLQDVEDTAEPEQTEETNDDEVVVHMAQHQEEEEEDQNFEREFNKLMQEYNDSRRTDRKTAVFDAPIPTRRNNPEDDASVSSNQVSFSILTKKGNKQQVFLALIKADSSFAIRTLSKQQAEQEERVRLKQLVLNYEERERQDSNKPVEPLDASGRSMRKGKSKVLWSNSSSMHRES